MRVLSNIILLLLFPFSVFAVKDSMPEKLLGISYDHIGVTFQVESNGCTGKSNFSLIQKETYPPRITLVRVKPDLCEAYATYGVDIKFTYKELGQKPGYQFEIDNELKRLITIWP